VGGWVGVCYLLLVLVVVRVTGTGAVRYIWYVLYLCMYVLYI